MDFVSDSLSSGRRIKCLTIADDFSHECVDIAVDYGISGQYVTRLLDQAAIFRAMVSDLARICIAEWRRDYNEVKPHSSLGRIPPAQFAQQHRINSNAAANKNHQVLE